MKTYSAIGALYLKVGSSQDDLTLPTESPDAHSVDAEDRSSVGSVTTTHTEYPEKSSLDPDQTYHWGMYHMPLGNVIPFPLNMSDAPLEFRTARSTVSPILNMFGPALYTQNVPSCSRPDQPRSSITGGLLVTCLDHLDDPESSVSNHTDLSVKEREDGIADAAYEEVTVVADEAEPNQQRTVVVVPPVSPSGERNSPDVTEAENIIGVTNIVSQKRDVSDDLRGHSAMLLHEKVSPSSGDYPKPQESVFAGSRNHPSFDDYSCSPRSSVMPRTSATVKIAAPSVLGSSKIVRRSSQALSGASDFRGFHEEAMEQSAHSECDEVVKHHPEHVKYTLQAYNDHSSTTLCSRDETDSDDDFIEVMEPPSCDVNNGVPDGNPTQRLLDKEVLKCSSRTPVNSKPSGSVGIDASRSSEIPTSKSDADDVYSFMEEATEQPSFHWQPRAQPGKSVRRMLYTPGRGDLMSQDDSTFDLDKISPVPSPVVAKKPYVPMTGTQAVNVTEAWVGRENIFSPSSISFPPIKRRPSSGNSSESENSTTGNLSSARELAKKRVRSDGTFSQDKPPRAQAHMFFSREVKGLLLGTPMPKRRKGFIQRKGRPFANGGLASSVKIDPLRSGSRPSSPVIGLVQPEVKTSEDVITHPPLSPTGIEVGPLAFSPPPPVDAVEELQIEAVPQSGTQATTGLSEKSSGKPFESQNAKIPNISHDNSAANTHRKPLEFPRAASTSSGLGSSEDPDASAETAWKSCLLNPAASVSYGGDSSDAVHRSRSNPFMTREDVSFSDLANVSSTSTPADSGKQFGGVPSSPASRQGTVQPVFPNSYERPAQPGGYNRLLIISDFNRLLHDMTDSVVQELRRREAEPLISANTTFDAMKNHLVTLQKRHAECAFEINRFCELVRQKKEQMHECFSVTSGLMKSINELHREAVTSSSVRQNDPRTFSRLRQQVERILEEYISTEREA